MSDAANAADLVAAIPAVLGTSFGHDLIAQALSVLAALVLLTAWPSRRFAAVGLGTATPSGTWPEPAALCGGTAPPCRRCLARRIAAAADPGARRPAGEPSAETLRRFSKLATLCVIAIAGIACFQGWVLSGGMGGLIGTAYGSLLLLKAALFAALLALAAFNRFRPHWNAKTRKLRGGRSCAPSRLRPCSGSWWWQAY